MRTHVGISHARLFAQYAGKDLAKWRELVAQRVEHRLHGWGTVADVVAGEAELIVKICFDEDDGQISNVFLARFCDEHWFPNVTLPRQHSGIGPLATVRVVGNS